VEEEELELVLKMALLPPSGCTNIANIAYRLAYTRVSPTPSTPAIAAMACPLDEMVGESGGMPFFSGFSFWVSLRLAPVSKSLSSSVLLVIPAEGCGIKNQEKKGTIDPDLNGFRHIRTKPN
jgi:hypothetical protein